MTTTHSAEHRPIHFPGRLVLGPDGILAAPPRQRLEEIAAAAVDHDALLIFASRLVKGASRRRFKPARVELNRCYLELAQLCIDRALADCRTVIEGGRA
jgi:hypothetical protein